MTVTAPREGIENTHREVVRYREDVDAWREKHAALSDDCWAWEDLIARANFLFDLIMRADLRVQRYLLVERGSDGLDLQERLREALEEWSKTSQRIVPQGERLQQDYGQVEGLETLRENIAQATSCLTPDADFFGSDALVELRDQAIDAHRAGSTEPI